MEEVKLFAIIFIPLFAKYTKINASNIGVGSRFDQLVNNTAAKFFCYQSHVAMHDFAISIEAPVFAATKDDR